ALGLAAEGAQVVVNDYGVALDGSVPSSGPAFDVVEEIRRAGGRAVPNTDSVATWEGAARIIGTALGRWGRLDALVTCAGIRRDRMVFNMSEEEWDAVIAVHLKGTFNCVRHACTHMRERRYGRIVTFSSGAGLFGNPGQANYGAAKSAIGGLTKVAARDLGKYGITVNAICPVAGTRLTVNGEVRRARAAGAGDGPRGPREPGAAEGGLSHGEAARGQGGGRHGRGARHRPRHRRAARGRGGRGGRQRPRGRSRRPRRLAPRRRRGGGGDPRPRRAGGGQRRQRRGPHTRRRARRRALRHHGERRLPRRDDTHDRDRPPGGARGARRARPLDRRRGAPLPAPQLRPRERGALGRLPGDRRREERQRA